MSLQRNHYEVLGVPRTATTDEIKTKYRELARKFHPDIAKDKVMGQKIFSQINQAYRVLGDPERRAQYDAGLAVEASASVRNGAAPNNGSGVSAATAPSTPNPANVARLLAEAETASLQNNIGKVKAVCDKILETDPRNHKALGMLGDVLVQMGRPQEAAAAYQQALQIAPSVGLQAKLSRLQGGAANGNGATSAPRNGAAAPRPQPVPPMPQSNGMGKNRTDQGRTPTDQGRAEKPAGGLFSRLLGKK